LVAVSKTKPAALVAEAYALGQRHFGENYAQELLEKAPALPADVAWHFIGHLQTNKAAALVRGVPNLAMVESVDSERLATVLSRAVEREARPPLAVLVEVNVAGEASKYGVAPGAAVALATHVARACPHLQLRGLMTLGRAGDPTDAAFECLVGVRARVADALGVEPATLELSMGMSADFERAVRWGATNVRVGSDLFGARDAPPAAAAAAAAADAAPASTGAGPDATSARRASSSSSASSGAGAGH
jgi:hypothetical protein